jgi:16S rRNA (guanine527-N7)-methyltransferase
MKNYRDNPLLKTYVDELLKWNKKINLIGKETEAEVWERHIEDSLRLADFIADTDVSTIVDIGSGGGLPAIPLAVTLPDKRFVLTDVADKKLAFLEWIIGRLKLNASAYKVSDEFVISERCIITARAFSSVKNILQWRKKHCPNATKFFLLKGKEENSKEEMSEAGVSGEIVKLPRGTLIII